MNRFIRIGLFLVSGLSVFAAPVRFDFTFQNPQTLATAAGYIVFEDTLLPNPGSDFFNLPHPAVLDLQVTVSGASGGNGDFFLADFTGVVWDTAGGTLDFGLELVGQPTMGNPWGTPGGGDFNLFSMGGSTLADAYAGAGDGGIAPQGVDPFTLGAAAGTADPMVLVAMRRGASVPSLSQWGLIALIVSLAGLAIWMKRR